MTAPGGLDDASVDILFRFAEQGDAVAAKAQAQLDGFGAAAKRAQAAADNAATGGFSRLGSAFQRLEAREPTMALRSTRGAIEAMALSAAGAEGPLGRVVANFALLGAGSAVGLAFLGFIAAAGLAFKALNADIAATNKEITEAASNIERMAAVGHRAQQGLALIGARAARAELTDESPDNQKLLNRRELSVPELFSNAVLRQLRSAAGFSGPTSQDEVAQIRAQSEATAILIAERRLEAQTMHEQAAAVERNQRTLTEARLQLARARLGPHASVAQQESIARQLDHERLARMTSLGAKERETIENLDAETRARERLNARILEGERNFERVFGKVTGIPLLRPGHTTDGGFLGVGPVTSGIAQFHLEGGRLVAGPRPPDIFSVMGAGAPDAALHGDIADVGKKIGDRSGEQIARTLAATLPALIGAAARGDAGSALQTAGGALAGLGNIKGLQDLSVPGLVISTLGSIVSLFSSGGAKVSILSLEDRALDQIKSLAGAPRSTQVVIVDASSGKQIAATRFAIKHEERLDGQPRLPGG